MGFTRPQTWQIVNQENLEVLETTERESLANINKILDSKLDYPFRLSLAGSVITLQGSEIQTIKSDGAGSFSDSYKIAASPILGKYKKILQSSLNLITGATTGDFEINQTSSAPLVPANNYIKLGIELRSNGKFYLVWGSPAINEINATEPIFTSGDSVCLIILQKDGTGDPWKFLEPSAEKTVLFKESNALEIRDDVIHKTKVIDIVNTALPTGSAVTLDGVSLANDDMVFFTSFPIEGLYRLSGVGSSVVWDKILNPKNGDNIQVTEGTDYFKTIWKRIDNVWRPLEVSEAVKEPSGFPNRTDSTFSFNNATRTFTIEPSGFNSKDHFDFFRRGIVTRVIEPQSVTISDVEGVHYIYYGDPEPGNPTGLKTTQNVSYVENIIREKAYVATVSWNEDDNQAILLGDERHGITMDHATHKYLHLSVGTVLQSGLSITQIPGNGSTETSAEFKLGNGRLFDEDIDLRIINSNSPSGFFEQKLDPIAEIPMYYKSGSQGHWRRFNATSKAVVTGINGIQYNKNELGSWIITEAANAGETRYVTTWVFATNSVTEPVIGLVGQNVYDSLTEAQEKEQYAGLNTSGLPIVEFKLLFRVIWETSDSYTNSVKSLIADVQDLRIAPDAPFPSVAINDHGLLSGLSDPDHPPIAVTTAGVNLDGAFSSSDIDLKNALETLNNLFGQLRVKTHESVGTRVRITGADRILNSSTQLGQAIGLLLLSFEGAQIDFSNGQIFEYDGTTPLGINFTPSVIPNNHYQWYSVNIVPSTLDTITNKLIAQVLVIPASSSSLVRETAPQAPFAPGVKVGQVLVRSTGSGIVTITNQDIIQLGVGSGGGGGDGTGDANELLERLKDRLEQSRFEYVTPNIFSSTAETETDIGTTALYSVVASSYVFENIDDLYISKNSLDQDYLNNFENESLADLDKIEVVSYYDLNNIDDTPNDPPIYQLSRDGGFNWQQVSMSRIGLSDTLTGTLNFQEEPSYSYIETFGGTSAGTFIYNGTNSGARRIELSVANVVKNIRVQIGVLNIPTGTITAKIVKDIGGVASTNVNDVFAYSKPHIITGSSTGFVNFPITCPLPAGFYHVIFETDSVYKENFNTSGGTNRISMSRDSVSLTSIIFTVEGRSLNLKIRIQGRTPGATLRGYGLFYKIDSTQAALTDDYLEHIVEFNGLSQNLSEFTLPFLPDRRLLKIYEIKTGQIYRHGAFSIDGYKIIFPPSTFSKPETIRLLFEQTSTSGGGYSNIDTTDKNFSLLLSNNLGSTDPQLDLSANGRGIYLRRPDGVLREIAIDNDDNITVYST